MDQNIQGTEEFDFIHFLYSFGFLSVIYAKEYDRRNNKDVLLHYLPTVPI